MSGRRTTCRAFASTLSRRSPASTSTTTACHDLVPSPISQSSVQPALAQATVDPFAPDWLRRLLALPQPPAWMPPGLRWPPARNLPVGPTDTTATPPEPDEPAAAFRGSDPDETNSVAASARDDGQFHPQAGVSGPWVRSTGAPPLPATPSSVDPNCCPRQRGRRWRGGGAAPGTAPDKAGGAVASGTGQDASCAWSANTQHGNDRIRTPARAGIRRSQKSVAASDDLGPHHSDCASARRPELQGPEPAARHIGRNILGESIRATPHGRAPRESTTTSRRNCSPG